MGKKKYIKAEAEIIRFSNEDIICTSGGGEEIVDNVYVCQAWANQNNVPCSFSLTRTW